MTDDYSSLVVAQLLYLQSEDSKKPINMYINSPGIAYWGYLGGIYDYNEVFRGKLSILMMSWGDED